MFLRQLMGCSAAAIVGAGAMLGSVATAQATMLPIPPSTTARTAPNQCAVNPLSYSPSSFEAPRNSQFTLDTRPRISGGVASCRMLDRTTTLMPRGYKSPSEGHAGHGDAAKAAGGGKDH